MKMLFVCLLFLFATASSAPAIQPLQKLEGLSLGEWGIRWWQWASSAPENKDPVRDLTGIHCAVGQSGKVWFLAGTYENGKQIRRQCTIPAGKSLVFPLVNMYADCTSFLAQTAFLNAPRELKLSIDQQKFDYLQLMQFRGRIECGKNKFFPELGFDGYYVALLPLPKGKHNISYSAQFGTFSQNVAYELIVK